MTTEEQYRLPTEAELEAAADLQVFDSSGNAHAFRSLWDRHLPTERRNIIIFIRHFFCGTCQEYVRALSKQISTAGLYLRNPPTTLTIIGCGDPSLIPEYITRTDCKFELYANPTHDIYDALGMTCNFVIGERPQYFTKSFLGTSLMGMWDVLSNFGTNPGKKNQNGGEFIFVDGEIKWCHRMKTTRDHAEVDELRQVLDRLDQDGDRDGKYATEASSDGSG